MHSDTRDRLHPQSDLLMQICKDCRCNVMRAYKDLKPGAKEQKAGDLSSTLEICPGHSLSVVDGLVCVDGKTTTKFFKQAEKVEECNVSCSLCIHNLVWSGSCLLASTALVACADFATPRIS